MGVTLARDLHKLVQISRSGDTAVVEQEPQLLAVGVGRGAESHLPSGFVWRRTADCQIASIAHTRGATVATRNTPDFEGCEIDLINPWTAA